MNKDIRLYNVVKKEDETRFIVVKAGCFFSLTYDNIGQMEDVIRAMKKRKRQEAIGKMLKIIKNIFKK